MQNYNKNLVKKQYWEANPQKIFGYLLIINVLQKFNPQKSWKKNYDTDNK